MISPIEKAYEFKSKLMGFFANRLRDVSQDDLEDLASETFIYAGHYIDKVDDKFPARLFAIARIVLKSFLSQLTKHPIRSLPEWNDEQDNTYERKLLTDYYDDSGINWNMIFEKIMKKMSNKEKRFIRLVLDGYTLREIADILGYSNKITASATWRKILRKIRKEMEEMGFVVGEMTYRIRREDYGKRRVYRKGG